MHDTEKSVAVTKGYVLYKSLLILYPESYRKKFEQEMLTIFEDISQEQLRKSGKTGISFWLSLSFDIARSAAEQHMQLLKKQGMKKYIHQTLLINRYNIIGALLLLPFLTVFAIDVLARILQGDLVHYNRPVYNYLSHTPFYWTPNLFIWVILFPALAVFTNLIPLIKNSIKKRKTIFQFVFLRENAVTLLILAVGLGFLAIIKLHDFAPCMIHGLLRVGIGQLPKIISVCKNV